VVQTPVSEDKHALRASLRSKRKDQGTVSGAHFAHRVLALAEFQTVLDNDGVIGCYLSLPNEPSTRDIRDHLHAIGARVVVPRVISADAMEWCWDSITDDPYSGIPEPTGDCADVAPSLLIIPALAIDHEGYRLGQGGGYFDRLTDDAPRIALIFDHELLERVPREPHDRAVDIAITPERTMRFSALTER